MTAWFKSLHESRRWMLIVSGIVFVFLLGLLSSHFHLRSPFGPDSEASAVSRPNPAEFLYLDNERVAAYLAQLNGGIAKSERLTEMLRTEEGAKAGGDLFEVGASAQRENFVERQVSPTAAANFFRLLAVLNQLEEIAKIKVKNLHDLEGLHEGSFVFFSSRDVRTPVYANSYLVVRQAGTMKALFPTAHMDSVEREEIEGVREGARSFAHQVGSNPRLVFALTPRMTKGEKKKRDAASEMAPRQRRKVLRRLRDNKVKFLLPVRYRQLTDERSLIKDGGGAFKVVGKLVRVFPVAPKGSNAVYRDSPTWETWKSPLENAPGALLEQSSRLCGTKPGARRVNELSPSELRECVLKRLEEQTEIPRRGAVILPIAIYK